MEQVQTLTAMKPDKSSQLEPTLHLSVLPKETLYWLAPHPGGRYIDGTLGGGGHAELILAQSAPDGQVLGIDADQEATLRIRTRLHEALTQGRLQVQLGNFDEMETQAQALGFAPVDGILLDLGLSSDQLASSERGFSFSMDAPLDMRFDPTRGQPASELSLPTCFTATPMSDALAPLLGVSSGPGSRLPSPAPNNLPDW